MTDLEYLNKVLDKRTKPSQIMKELTMPKCVFKYRRFNNKRSNEGRTVWQQSMDGRMYFSKSTSFNANDENDCEVICDRKPLIEYIKNKYSSKNGGSGLANDSYFIKLFEDYLNSIREGIHIACFTECNPEKPEIWDKKDFGDNHKGFCVEYEVDEDIFYPNNNVFLKIVYNKVKHDLTEVLKNFIDYNYNRNKGYYSKEAEFYNPEIATVIANGYNFALIKPLQYKDEQEWRIIVTSNKFEEYFDVNKQNTKDFSQVMRAIYLGADSVYHSNFEEYKSYALSCCEKMRIPLYLMKHCGDKLVKEILYNVN